MTIDSTPQVIHLSATTRAEVAPSATRQGLVTITIRRGIFAATEEIAPAIAYRLALEVSTAAARVEQAAMGGRP